MSEPDLAEGWGFRFHAVVAAGILANAFGAFFAGPEFLLLGWLLNVPCGLFHYLIVQQGHKHGDPLGTLMIAALPWAQTLLTALVVGLGALWVIAYRIQTWIPGKD